MFCYRAFGVTFASDLECPELPEASGPADVRIDVSPENAARPAAGFVAEPGRFELNVPRVAHFTVTAGTAIAIRADPRADAASIRLFLLGTAVGALLHQRGDLPLHGSAVHKDGRSAVILGVSGAGKSSLAAALRAHGWQLQSDDIAVVRPYDGVAHCEAGFPRRKMWPDMLEQLGHDPRSHVRVREGIEKRFQEVPAAEFYGGHAPVRAVIALTPSRAATPELTPLPGPLGMAMLKRQTFRANLRAPLLMHVRHFEIIAMLAAQAAVWRVQRPRTGSSPQVLADLVAPLLDGAVAEPGPA